MKPYKARIRWRGINHPVQQWARARNIKDGTIFPAPCAIADKPGGKKGHPVAYDDKKLKELLLLNGNNQNVFRFATRIGGWLFNTASNRHLIGKLKGLLWWMNNYVPYPLPKGKKAFAEKIYCDGNEVVVDKVKGKWAHLAPGIGTLTQVAIGTGQRFNSYVIWRVPAGWIERSLLERI